MKILVTGGDGFLGSRLVEELRRRDHGVIGIDRAYGDLRAPAVIKRALDSYVPDMVVHLAAMPGRLFCDLDEMRAVTDNAGMTTIIARECGRRSVRLTYVSTSEVYGVNDWPCREDDESVLRPRNIYGLTKLWGEEVCQLYAPDGLVVLRPTMPYGPGQQVGRGRAALPTFVWNALHGLPSEVHRDTSRSWCYVDDVISGMALAVERGEGTYNCGRDDDSRTSVEVAIAAYEAVGAVPDLRVSDPDPTITRHKVLVMDELRALGWEPTVSLEEGLRRVADDLRTRMLEEAAA